MEKIKWAASMALGAMASFAKQYHAIIIFVLLAIIIDFITGVTKAKATGEGLNSRKATLGFWKKFALFVALCFGFFLDYFIPYMLRYLHVDLPATALFGMVFGCYIVINESISVVENLYMINPAILPVWVSDLLSSAKNQIDKHKED